MTSTQNGKPKLWRRYCGSTLLAPKSHVGERPDPFLPAPTEELIYAVFAPQPETYGRCRTYTAQTPESAGRVDAGAASDRCHFRGDGSGGSLQPAASAVCVSRRQRFSHL